MTARRPISLTRRFFLANAMLLMYFFSVTISVCIAMLIGHLTVDHAVHDLMHLAMRRYAPYYDLPVSILVVAVVIFYERPIRRLINHIYIQKKSSRREVQEAQRRLLNEPFFLMAINLTTWIGAALVYYLMARSVMVQHELANELIISSLLTAVIGVLATFFSLQFCIQHWLAPVLFPEGGLSQVKGALRIKLSTRLAAFTAATCLAPLLMIGVTLYGAEQKRLYGVHPERVMDHFSATLTIELVLFSLVAILLTLLVAVNLSRPFRNIIAVLNQIKRGRFDQRVRVVSNDEIGYTGDTINEMAAGLQERERMQRSLSLAREVQQGLLPKSAPMVPNLEISGTSLYCDETGGDFFDYILLDHQETSLLGTVIGDVSGHGVSAALLMTSIRSLLRARTILPGDPGEIVNHLNQQITRDTEETGQFVTLFYLEIQPNSRALSWVRAGHDPAYLYRSATDTVETLEGLGSALGIRADAFYSTASGQAAPGDVIVMTTDGIFETRNNGKMFGRQRLIRVVRKNSALSAVGIRDAIIEAVNNFRGFSPQEDDVTLVVIKFL